MNSDADQLGQETLESMSLALWYNNWTLRQFESFLKGQILEVGSGIGNFTSKLTEYGHVTAIDINDHYLKYLKQLGYRDLEMGEGNIEKGRYFFTGRRFNTIVCLNVLEHIADDTQALKNLYHLLKKEGHLVLLVPTNPHLFGEIDKSIGHYRRYDKGQLVARLKATGFEIIRSRRINFLGGIGWWFSGKVLKSKTVKPSSIQIFNLIAPLALAVENLFEPPIGTSVLVIAKRSK